MWEQKNAKIDHTRLGVQHTNHGILSFSIGLNYGGGGQSFGMITLDNFDKDQDKRVATLLAGSLLLAIDDVFRVDWEKLGGLSCRALSTNCQVRAIGHYLKDKWLWFDVDTMAFVVTTFDQVPKHI